MMDLLQHCETVKEAIHYLPTRPHFGDGSVTVLDARGDMAVFEIAHSVQAVRQSDQGFVASTNHFTAPETRSFWVDREPTHLMGNSQGRLRLIEDVAALGKRAGGYSLEPGIDGAHGDNLQRNLPACRG